MKFEQGDLIVNNLTGDVAICHVTFAIPGHAIIQYDGHEDGSEHRTINIALVKTDNWEILEKAAFKHEFVGRTK